MRINLWYSPDVDHWRWTLTSTTDNLSVQESGTQQNLRTAMNDIAATVEYILVSKGTEILVAPDEFTKC
jgi:hypothetical protein